MSARRRGRGESLDVFDENPNSAPSLVEVDASIFGEIDKIDAGRQVAKPISIFDISPDLTQPRRAVPSVVRENWDGRPETVRELIGQWQELAFQERGQEFDVYAYLLPEEEVTRPEKVGPIESSFLDVIELAASIRKHGLTNPITIVRIGSNQYRLETGERRWLAYHALHIYENENRSWEKIPARIVDDGADVWRQASENGVRSNLNAIGKARQIALLVMDIHRKRGVTFRPYSEMVKPGGSDRAFYAQVADGNRYPVTGHGEAIINALGFKQASQYREHRELLSLPDEVWRLADDLSWAYGRIRDLKRKSLGDNKRFIQLAVDEAFNQGYGVGILTTTSPTPPQSKKEKVENPYLTRKNKQLFTRVQSAAKLVGEGGLGITVDDLNNIQQLRIWLDHLEKAINEKLKK